MKKPLPYDLNALPEDRDGIEDMLVQVQAEIDDISTQLAETEIEDEDDRSWAIRAETARRFRFAVRAKLTQRLRKLEAAHRPPSDALRMQEMRLEAARANAEAARAKAARVADNLQRADRENRAKIRALLDWLRASHPALATEAMAVVRRVEDEHRAAGGGEAGEAA